MRDNITLGEMKACCVKMVAEYGDACCENCEYADMGCCNPPDTWELEPGVCESRPNWEEMYGKVCEDNRLMHMKAEDSYARAKALEGENLKLRTIVGTLETLLGRKFEV